MSRRVMLLFIMTVILVTSLVAGVDAQQRRSATNRRSVICGDPMARCPVNSDWFQPYDLQFKLPERFGIIETQPFYAVILKSLSDPNCNANFSEEERQDAQRLFPHRKVFASKCGEPGTVYYTSIAHDHQIMAVYAGETMAEAQRVLNEVKATGRFNGANIRRMRAGFNGT